MLVFLFLTLKILQNNRFCLVRAVHFLPYKEIFSAIPCSPAGMVSSLNIEGRGSCLPGEFLLMLCISTSKKNFMTHHNLLKNFNSHLEKYQVTTLFEIEPKIMLFNICKAFRNECKNFY